MPDMEIFLQSYMRALLRVHISPSGDSGTPEALPKLPHPFYGLYSYEYDNLAVLTCLLPGTSVLLSDVPSPFQR